jgi:two-component system OmpR family response regulator
MSEMQQTQTHGDGDGMPGAAELLVVDDHADIREPLTTYLQRQGFAVHAAADAVAARQLLQARPGIQLVVLDVMLPGEDGLSLCRDLRGGGGPPVILLTAKAASADRVAGLEQGADDYVVKPFDPPELVARIRNVLRRVGGAVAARPDTAWSDAARVPAPRPAHRYSFDRWVFDRDRQEVQGAQGERIALSTAEARLLAVLLRHPRQVLDRERLLELMHEGETAQVFDRSIDTQISRLRRKIESDPRRPALVKTAWGNGYLLAADVSVLA